MSRRKLREHLFKMVFLCAFNKPEEMDEQVERYLAGVEELDGEDSAYLMRRFAALSEHLSEIDTRLNNTAKGWRTERFGSCELAILRVAVFEILFDETIPDSVAINEAVELTKLYGNEGAHSFVNGILGEIVRSKEKDAAHG